MMDRTFACCLLALVAPTACATDVEAPSEEVDGDDQAATRLDWVFSGSCASSIDVAPDNTIWIVAGGVCDSDPRGGLVWMMRQQACTTGFCSGDEWTPTNVRAKSVTVDNGGEPDIITVDGVRLNGQERVASSGPFRNMLVPLTTFERHPETGGRCWKDFRFQHRDDYGLFIPPTGDVVKDDDHWAYAIGCDDEFHVIRQIADDGSINIVWNDLYELQPAAFALFDRPNPSGARWQEKNLVILQRDGGMITHTMPELNGERFASMRTPRGVTYGLTNGFALTSEGVVQWTGSDWQSYLPNRTPTGAITQIAHAGVSATGVGPSMVWAIDEVGNIYKAKDTTNPR